MSHFPAPLLHGIFFATLLGLCNTAATAQQKQKYTVAVFLYQGVELLDFAGPGEAFSATPDFNVYTVSVDGKEVLSQGFVTVKPQYAMADAPTPDIIVFPGGNVSATANDPKIAGWINTLASGGTTVMSVCNGAIIVAGTGLLNGLTVTTHHNAIAHLRKMLPHSTVLEDAKYVDNGNIITAAGVSSGIDGALHVISRIKGRDVARSVAFYMEYNKWKPEEGMVVYKNEYLEKYKNGTTPGANEKIPYEGELKNLAQELLDNGKTRGAADVMEQAVKWYPWSGSSYNLLGKAYTRLGKPAPMDQDQFVQLIDSGKIDQALLVYDQTQKAFPGWLLFDEGTIGSEGSRLFRNQAYIDAVRIFSLNTRSFPQSWNAWDDLATANLKAGNQPKAIEAYRRSLELNPKNDNARAYLAQFASN